MRKVTRVSVLLALMAATAVAQETRSMLFGRVLDPQASAVAGASVVIRNTETGVALSYKTNETGYYEANLLLPGSYEITAEAAGFKKLHRQGIVLPVSSRLNVDLSLEVGGVTEVVSITAEAPLLETNAVSSGRVIDNRTLMELPIMGNSAMLLAKLTPGIQVPGVNNYLALHSIAGGSEYSVAGNIGGNAWSLDGSPNQGASRRSAYLPYTDAVAEFKVETSNFDASIGQTSGASIQMITKSGSNELHGTATWQHWQQRWQGTPFFTKQQYYGKIAAAEAAGNKTLADQLRNTDKQTTGRSNNWGASGGGPLVIPKIYDGKNKLFWFFTYNAFKDVKTEDPSNFNRTVPTLKAREGDFNDMLLLPNSSRYIVYDPITIKADPARATHFIRTPFPNNIIPKSRFANPAYDAIMKMYPLPSVAIPPGQEPVNNYLANKMPYNWTYYAYSNRVDYQLSDKVRMYGRWSINNFGPEDRSDWTYETVRTLNSNGLVRNNKGGNFDVVWTQSATTIWDFNGAMNQYKDTSVNAKAWSYKATDIGLPAYIDQKAGRNTMLPRMVASGYTTISPGGVNVFTKYRTATGKAEVTKIAGNHTLRGALDIRGVFKTGGGLGDTTGTFTFSSFWTRKDDDGNAANSNLPLGWASFILGIPNNGGSISGNDSYATFTPYRSGFFQDSWRLTKKLTLNLGLRMEWEGGLTERYNRMMTNFDATAALPIAAAAQAAYAAAPIAELPAASFKVVGGNLFAGVNGQPRNWFQNELLWLPRIGVAYQMNDKTVIRAGYGVFYDTLNAANFSVDQSGYSRGTSTNYSTDFGQTWNMPAGASPANGKSPLMDPFPVRADGTRFDVPTRDALGVMAKAGRGWTYSDYNYKHARQQRWRAGVQRQLGRSWVVDAAYAGSYSDQIPLSRNESPLPEQYWADGLKRNDAIATRMNANVTNPFLLKNFASMATSAPLIYADMATQGFFTSSTIRVNTLLRAFPQMNGLTRNNVANSWTRTHEFQASLEKRFAQGFNLNLGYTGVRIREADFFWYEWDRTPTERISNDGRPHRIVGSGVYEFPVGRGRKFLSTASKPVDLLLGGWQMGATYEWQPGPQLDWSSTIFYYGGDPNKIADYAGRNWDKWFDTTGSACTDQPTTGFEKCSSRTATSYHRRVFPTRIPDLRRDSTNQWNANLAKNLKVTERVNLQLRLNVLNVQNRSQMDAPSTDPLSTNFGRITAQTAATNRWIDVQARIRF